MALELLMFGASVGLGMIPFALTGHTDPTIKDRTTLIRIGSGIFTGENRTMPGMGSIPGLAIFDINGVVIAKQNRGGSMPSYAEFSLVASKDVNYLSPEYLSVSSGDNAICIAYLQIISSDGVHNTWTGDVAEACRLPYYLSHHAVNDAGYSPSCMWLQGRSNFAQDGTTGFRGMGIHIPDFIAAETDIAKYYKQNMGLLCASTARFWLYDELTQNDNLPYFSPALKRIDYYVNRSEPFPDTWKVQPVAPVPDAPFISAKARSITAETNTNNAMRMPGTLIVTSLPHQDVILLCNDKFSAGPDFVSLVDGIFCDMDNKRDYPLCTGSDKDACFDLESKTLRPAPVSHRYRRDQVSSDKTYSNVVNWR